MKKFFLIWTLSLTSFIFAPKTIERGPGTWEDHCQDGKCEYDEKTDTLSCTCCRGDAEYGYNQCHQTQLKNASRCDIIRVSHQGTLYCLDDDE